MGKTIGRNTWLGSQYNVVSILSSPWLTNAGFDALQGQETLSVLQNVQNGYESKPVTHSVGNVTLLNVKQPQCGTDHPKVKNK